MKYSHLAIAIIFFFVGIITVNISIISKDKNVEVKKEMREEKPVYKRQGKITYIDKDGKVSVLIPKEKDPEPTLMVKPVVSLSPVQNEEETILDEPLIREYYLQLGTFQYEYFAYRLKNKLKEKGYKTHVNKTTIKGQEYYIVKTASFGSKENAQKHREVILKFFPDLKSIPIQSKIK